MPLPSSRSSELQAIGRGDSEEITGGVRKEPAANAGAATATRTSIRCLTSTASAAMGCNRNAAGVSNHAAQRIHGAPVAALRDMDVRLAARMDELKRHWETVR